MKILYSTCALCLLTAFMWFPCSTQGNAQGLTKEELDDQIQKNLNTPIACGCSVYDYDDLDNRIKLASMIRSEFAAAKKQYAGKKQTLTPEIRNTVQNPIRGKINSTKNPKANDAGAVTYDFGCFTIMKPFTGRSATLILIVIFATTNWWRIGYRKKWTRMTRS
jgi:hypothetical protein